MLYFVPVLFFIGTSNIIMEYPVWLAEPVLGCIATITYPAKLKTIRMECYKEDGTILKVTVTGKYKV